MISRARALLGTLVSVRSDAPEAAVRAALGAVEAVHRLMNAHSDDGDVARINRHGHRRPVRVHCWTYRVLCAAQALSRASAGAFDPTLGRRATFEDVELLPSRRVRLRRRAKLDLGGIAKGFAVDVAVAALRRRGARTASVNAGGDLRFFARQPQVIRVRLPGDPSLAVPVVSAAECAFATSGAYFGGALVDPRSERTLGADHSVSVRARTCMVADALTKAVAVAGPRRALLKRFGAEAFLLDASGTLYRPRA
jgi:thiamine biosynthesis lipoprotein